MIWPGGILHEAAEVGDALIGAFQNPGLLTGIPLALLGAVFMSFGAQYQHRGVIKVERLSGADATTGLSVQQLKRLFTRPSWLVGTTMLGLAILCQLSALSVAPIIVVQPLGAIALVITTILNARISGDKPTRRSVQAIVQCVGGIFLFVTIAALVATEERVSDVQLVTILIAMGVVSFICAGAWLLLRRHLRALFYIVAAGVMYGFVATLAKVVISRIQTGDFEWLTFACVIALLAAAGLGAYFVQSAYSSGPPDLVIAGLTVIDPIVAILIGLLVLGEASQAPPWAFFGFGVGGVIAVIGVLALARHHPQFAAPRLAAGAPDAAATVVPDETPEPTTGSERLTEVVQKVWTESPPPDPASPAEPDPPAPDAAARDPRREPGGGR